MLTNHFGRECKQAEDTGLLRLVVVGELSTTVPLIQSRLLIWMSRIGSMTGYHVLSVQRVTQLGQANDRVTRDRVTRF